NDTNLQEALLILMSLLLQQTVQPEASEEHPAYLGFITEDTSIFAPAEVELRKHNPIETYEFEEEKLEDRIYRFSEVEEQDEGSKEDAGEDDRRRRSLDEEPHVDELAELNPPDLAVEKYKEIADLFDFYFDEEENLVAIVSPSLAEPISVATG
ncbi:15021_t:CDS:2, partial [Dentiscutata heterogama]